MANGKQRHVVLTAYLVFMFLWNALGVAVLIPYAIGRSSFKEGLGEEDDWSAQLAIPLTFFTFHCACVVGLWRLKKWGFYGYFLAAVAIVGLNLFVGSDSASSAMGLIWVLVLFAVLHVGKENKGWPQLD